MWMNSSEISKVHPLLLCLLGIVLHTVYIKVLIKIPFYNWNTEVGSETAYERAQLFWAFTFGNILIGTLVYYIYTFCLFEHIKYPRPQYLGLLLVLYEGSELGGKCKPRLCSRFEAGPASPSWQLRDSRRFETRLRSTSRGWISSSVSSNSPCVGRPFVAAGWGLPFSKSALLQFCIERKCENLWLAARSNIFHTPYKTANPFHF